jgi:SAM-dependent methyltransferase
MEPYGLALKEYFEGNQYAKAIFLRDDGLREDHFVANYFRDKNRFSLLDKRAISLSYGKVLDIGAGVGPLTLELQDLGFSVLAIDISTSACEIMKKRGVKNVRCTSVYNLEEKNFDTILLMGRAIGFVEDLSGLKRFLIYCRKLLKSDGIIILDSFDVRMTSNPVHLAYQDRNSQLGYYFGEIRLQMEYKGLIGEEFKILFIDPQTLKACARDVGWSCEIILEEENGNFLAKIYR